MTRSPLSPARDEENRRLAEWLEPFNTLPPNGLTGAHSPRNVWVDGWWDNETREWQPVDFFSDEAANALLLEQMPAPELYCHPPDHSGPEKGWRCRPDWGLDFAVYDRDRKTAIVKAYIAYREAQK